MATTSPLKRKHISSSGRGPQFRGNGQSGRTRRVKRGRGRVRSRGGRGDSTLDYSIQHNDDAKAQPAQPTDEEHGTFSLYDLANEEIDENGAGYDDYNRNINYNNNDNNNNNNNDEYVKNYNEKYPVPSSPIKGQNIKKRKFDEQERFCSREDEKAIQDQVFQNLVLDYQQINGRMSEFTHTTQECILNERTNIKLAKHLVANSRFGRKNEQVYQWRPKTSRKRKLIALVKIEVEKYLKKIVTTKQHELNKLERSKKEKLRLGFRSLSKDINCLPAYRSQYVLGGREKRRKEIQAISSVLNNDIGGGDGGGSGALGSFNQIVDNSLEFDPLQPLDSNISHEQIYKPSDVDFALDPETKIWCHAKEIQIRRLHPHYARYPIQTQTSLLLSEGKKTKISEKKVSIDKLEEKEIVKNALFLASFLKSQICSVERNLQDFGDEEIFTEKVDDYISESSGDDEEEGMHDWEEMRLYDNNQIVNQQRKQSNLAYYYPLPASRVPFTPETHFLEPQLTFFASVQLRCSREYRQAKENIGGLDNVLEMYAAHEGNDDGENKQDQNNSGDMTLLARFKHQNQQTAPTLLDELETALETNPFLNGQDPETDPGTRQRNYGQALLRLANNGLAHVQRLTEIMNLKEDYGPELCIWLVFRALSTGNINSSLIDRSMRENDSNNDGSLNGNLHNGANQNGNQFHWMRATRNIINTLRKLEIIQNQAFIKLGSESKIKTELTEKFNKISKIYSSSLNLLQILTSFVRSTKLDSCRPFQGLLFPCPEIEGLPLESLDLEMRGAILNDLNFLAIKLKNLCIIQQLQKDRRENYYQPKIIKITLKGQTIYQNTFYWSEESKRPLREWVFEQLEPNEGHLKDFHLLAVKKNQQEIVGSLVNCSSTAFPFHNPKRTDFSWLNGIFNVHFHEFIDYSQIKPGNSFIKVLYSPRIRYFMERDIHCARINNYLISGTGRSKSYKVINNSTVNIVGKAKYYQKKLTSDVFDAKLEQCHQIWQQEREMNTSTGNFFDQKFEINHLSLCYDISERECITMPALTTMQLINAQGFPEEVVKILLTFFGRIFFKMGGDNWQVMLWLLGPAETGKSTFVEILRDFYPTQRVGVLQENMEGTFGLWQLAEAWVWAGSDIAENWRFTKEVWQQQVSAETLLIPVKKEKAMTAKPDAHMIIAGNGFPRWHANKKQVLRRIILYPWAKRIPDSTPDIADHIKKGEKAQILFFTTRSYLDFFSEHADQTIWTPGVLPSFFEDNKKHINTATNKCYEFLISNEVVIYGKIAEIIGELQDDKTHRQQLVLRAKDNFGEIILPCVPMIMLEKAFREYLRFQGEKNLRWGPDVYQSAFDDLNLFVKDYEGWYPPPNLSAATTYYNKQKFVYGCCLRGIILEIKSQAFARSVQDVHQKLAAERITNLERDKIVPDADVVDAT